MKACWGWGMAQWVYPWGLRTRIWVPQIHETVECGDPPVVPALGSWRQDPRSKLTNDSSWISEPWIRVRGPSSICKVKSNQRTCLASTSDLQAHVRVCCDDAYIHSLTNTSKKNAHTLKMSHKMTFWLVLGLFVVIVWWLGGVFYFLFCLILFFRVVLYV